MIATARPTATDLIAGTNATAGARRIAAAFERAAGEGRAALIPYVVAGYPDPETSLRAAIAAADAGADLLEVGLPYSDPLADGATLQRASGAALKGSTTSRWSPSTGLPPTSCRSSRHSFRGRPASFRDTRTADRSRW